jgi:hypothetical protein
LATLHLRGEQQAALRAQAGPGLGLAVKTAAQPRAAVRALRGLGDEVTQAELAPMERQISQAQSAKSAQGLMYISLVGSL